MKACSVCTFCLCVFLALSGCNMPSVAAPIRTSEESLAATDTPVPPPPPNVTPSLAPGNPTTFTPTATSSLSVVPLPPVATKEDCLKLVDPQENAVFYEDQSIKFTWEGAPGATKYIMEITALSNWILSIETAIPSFEVSPEMFPGAKEYTWIVVALDSGENQICRSQPGKFSIAIREATPTVKPDRDDRRNREDDERNNWWDWFW